MCSPSVWCGVFALAPFVLPCCLTSNYSHSQYPGRAGSYVTRPLPASPLPPSPFSLSFIPTALSPPPPSRTPSLFPTSPRVQLSHDLVLCEITPFPTVLSVFQSLKMFFFLYLLLFVFLTMTVFYHLLPSFSLLSHVCFSS